MPSAHEVLKKAEKNIVRVAQQKLDEGKPLSQREMNLLARQGQDEFVESGMKFMAACPKRILVEQTHTTVATIHRLADSANCQELRKKELNLWIVLERLIRFPGEYKTRTGRNVNGGAYAPGTETPNGQGTVLDQLIFSGEDAEWQQKCYEEKFYALRDDRLVRQGELLPAEVIHDAHTRWAAILRDAGHKLALTYGNDAQQLLDQAVDDCTRVIEDTLDGWNASRVDAVDQPPPNAPVQQPASSGPSAAEGEAAEDSFPSELC